VIDHLIVPGPAGGDVGNEAAPLNPSDAAAEFSVAVNSFYVEDEFTFLESEFRLVGGLRYDG